MKDINAKQVKRWHGMGSNDFISRNQGGAHVVRCVRGPCGGRCSGPMLWEVFGAHVVGRIWGLCCGTCSGPLLWDVFGTHVVGHVQGLCCGTCSRSVLRDGCEVSSLKQGCVLLQRALVRVYYSLCSAAAGHESQQFKVCKHGHD